MRGVRIALGGTAKVYCVHDREKRLLRTPDDCARVARDAGLEPLANPKFQTCGCCENVFAALTDEPQLCHRCSARNVHSLGGPINDPIEGVL